MKYNSLIPVLCLTALVTCCQCPSAHARTVGDPRHPATLGAELLDAYQSGDRDITVAPGLYQLPATGKHTIDLDHWTDAKIRAAGVTLVFHDLTWAHRPVRFFRCTNVAFEGATLRLAEPAATQGRVIGVGADEQGEYCDWQVDAGYRSDIDPLKLTFNVVDSHTRVLKVRTGDVTPAASEIKGPGLFRFHFRHDRPKFEVGDWLVTRVSTGSVICHVDQSRNVTLKDLTLENGGFATIFETGGGGNHYASCHIHPGPNPPDSIEPQLVGCGADGFHSVGATIGPSIEDCTFDGVFLDDCIAIHGDFQKVISSSRTALVVEGGHDQYAVNEPVRISTNSGFFEQATCTAVKPLEGKEHHVELTLDRPMDVPADAKANNPNRCGRGFRILRCHLGNTRSRGILVKADDGLIDYCTIDGTGMSAVSIGPEYYWNEANYCWNVTVSHCLFRNCVKGNGHDGVVFVHGDGAIGNRKITLSDNTLDANFGDAIFRLEWTDDVKIAGNRITRAFELPLPKPGHVVDVRHARNVRWQGNQVVNSGPSAGAVLEIGEDVSGLIDETSAPP